MTKKHLSPALAAIHETAVGLADAGVIDVRTLKGFDRLCLTTVRQLSPKQIRAIRTRVKASQAVFALHLNVSKGLISAWERGIKKPGSPALKLLTLVARKGLQSVA